MVPVPPEILAVNVVLPFKQTAPPPEVFTIGSSTMVIVLIVVVTTVPHASVISARKL